MSIGTHGTTIVRFSPFGRIVAILFAVAFFALAYGIHTRARITWPAGFVGIAICYLNFVVGAVSSTYRLAAVHDFPSFWLPAGLVIVIGGAVTAFMGFWWRRQRSFFL